MIILVANSTVEFYSAQVFGNAAVNYLGAQIRKLHNYLVVLLIIHDIYIPAYIFLSIFSMSFPASTADLEQMKRLPAE